MEENIDITKLKYVLYARKSTDDPQRQLRSIPDQITECLDLANRLHLNVVNKHHPFTETKSAKIPNKRTVFNQMLKGLRNGEYDGILAWNPDRLARNMLEAGMLIDMVDSGVIKDFKFVTHVYSPDANGKMLLGMAFVLSKQYSDKLSQDVTRGVRGRLMEGKTPVPKHGYINEEGLYYPDGKNFDLISDAFQMRKTGASIEDINAYLNKNGYFKTVKKTGKKIKMTIQILSNVLHDPFYYGLLVQASQKVDLRLLNVGFISAINEEDYWAIQQLSYRKIRTKPHKLTFYPFRHMINCSYCGRFMVVAPSKGKTKHYLYFRCDNEACPRKKKSIRAKVLLDFIYNFLAEGLNLSEKEYREYLKSITIISDRKREDIQRELHNRLGLLKQVSAEIRERSLKIVNYNPNSRIYQENVEQIEKLQEEEKVLNAEVAKFNNQLNDPEKDRISIEQFLNLSKNAEKIVQSANERAKDIICRLIFLNFSLDEEKVASYQLKPPFDALLKTRDTFLGRGERN